MNNKQFVKMAYQAALVAVMVCSSSALFAQVKIGTNPTTINPANNLEVEATTAGRKTSVDKTTGQVTIADGTEGVNKILTSDANGAASWKTLPTGKLVLGVMPDNQTTTIDLPADGTKVYLGASITLPPGKWLVNSAGFIGAKTLVPAGGQIIVQLHLSTSQTSLVPPNSLSNTIFPGFITGQGITGSTSFHNSGSPMVIDVTATTTYYVVGYVYGNSSAPGVSGVATMSRNISGTAYLFAQSLDL